MFFSSLMMIIFMLIMTSLCCALLTDHYVSFFQDFGKYPHLRMFVQDYIYTLFCKDYADVVREFVER